MKLWGKKDKGELVFINSLECCFSGPVSFNYEVYFVNPILLIKKMESERSSDLPKVTQLVRKVSCK